jgi:hypothetical protein
MRITLVACVLAVIGAAAGCGPRQEAGPRSGPLSAGKLEGGTFWKNPLSAASNEGGDYPKGSRLEVYEQVVVVTTPDGLSHVHPHGHYSGLVFKKE